MKNQFEQHIKRSLEGFEADYNPADWSDMQNRLSQVKAGKPSNNIGKALLIAASVVVTSGVIYYFSTSEDANTNIVSGSADKVENVIEKNANENPVQPVQNNNESHSEQGTALSKEPVAKENTPVANKVAEEKPVAVENPEVANKVENKIPVNDEVQPSVSNVPVLSAAFRTDLSKICEGAQAQFMADNNDPSLSYKWNFGDGESSAEQSPKHAFAEAGTYTVKLRVTSKDKKQAEQKSTITVIAAPSVQLDYSASDDNGLLVNFEADGDKVIDWKWDFGDKKTSSSQNPVHTYSKRGNYKVSVTAKNSAGCSAVVVKDVNLKNEIDLLAPNAFSPDGNGVNDTWMPVALLNGDYIFTLTISNKAGNVVFRTSDKNNTWDGKGALVGDTFKWVAFVKDKNGEEIPCQGLITIAKE